MITLFLKPRYYQSTAEAPLAGGIVARSYHDKDGIRPSKRLEQTGAHSEALANLLFVHLHPHIHSMDLHKFLLTALLLSLLNYASYAAKSWEEDNFLKTCPPYRCNKHHEPRVHQTGGNRFGLTGSNRSGPVPVWAGTKPAQIQNLNLNFKK